MRFVKTFWPLLGIPPIALAAGWALHMSGHGWSAQEWTTNVIFAYVITISGAIMSRRQSQLQEALSAQGLIEKTGVISGVVDRISADPSASRVRQLLYDVRAGIELYRFSSIDVRREYLGAVQLALATIQDCLTRNLDAYTWWSMNDWREHAEVLNRLSISLELQASRSGEAREEVEGPRAALARLGSERPNPDVPFGVFQEHFSGGGAEAIRVVLDWNRLAELCESGGARIRRMPLESSLADLPRAFTPWHVTAAGRDTDWSDPAGRALSLRDSVAHSWQADSHRAERIDGIERSLQVRTSGHRPRLVVATLQLDESTLVVLDGSHRLSAWLRIGTRSPLRAVADVVEYRVIADRDALELVKDAESVLRSAAAMRAGRS